MRDNHFNSRKRKEVMELKLEDFNDTIKLSRCDAFVIIGTMFLRGRLLQKQVQFQYIYADDLTDSPPIIRLRFDDTHPDWRPTGVNGHDRVEFNKSEWNVVSTASKVLRGVHCDFETEWCNYEANKWIEASCK
jgi:hypothetical protein